MKHLIKTLVLGAAIAIAAPLAHATPISGTIGFGGNGSYDPSSHIFTAGPIVQGFTTDAYVNVPGTGTMTPFTMFNPTTFFTFNAGNASSTSGGVPVFTTTVGTGASAVTLSFSLTSLTTDGPSPGGGGSGLVGTGVLSETGYSSTGGTFALNTTTGAATFTTFSTAAITATPEPSTLMLLGSGLVSAAGMLVRRRRIA